MWKRGAREPRPLLTLMNCAHRYPDELRAQILRVALNEATVTLLHDHADRATVVG